MMGNRPKTKTSHIPCVVCGSVPTEKCHILSAGAGGSWDDSNIIQMCRQHHYEQHSSGWDMFIRCYPHMKEVLFNKGFEIREEFDIKKLRRI